MDQQKGQKRGEKSKYDENNTKLIERNNRFMQYGKECTKEPSDIQRNPSKIRRKPIYNLMQFLENRKIIMKSIEIIREWPNKRENRKQEENKIIKRGNPNPGFNNFLIRGEKRKNLILQRLSLLIKSCH